MSPKANAPDARPGRLESLLAAGDHRTAGREARAVLADAAAPQEQRARAGAVLVSLSPEPVSVALGLLGALGSAALVVWLTAGGGR